jgi:uncharacterized membrane protein
MQKDALVTIVVIGVIALALDAIWLTLRYNYHNALFAAIQHAPLSMRLLPAMGVYIVLPIIIYLSAVRYATSVRDAACKGAVTGALLYGFYDLTNYATLRGWTLGMTIVDTTWGATVCSASAAAAYYLLQ